MKNALYFLNPSEIKFHISDGDLLMLSLRGEDVGRVATIRMFPFQFDEEYICVRRENFLRTDKEKEIGIIRDLADLEKSQADIIRKELEKRYFIPSITEVFDVKDEIGHTFWKVKTTAGEREFTVTDMNINVKTLPDGKIMLTDVYGNRYYIISPSMLGDRVLKILEIWM